jgi:YesN/AraC family two-component response regulator
MTVRVLVVDDSADVRRLLSAIIDGPDDRWSVVGEAADGREAIDVARLTQPDLVLLDLSMPVMDGLEALPLIKVAAPGAAVVVLSGFPSHTARAAAIAAGATDYLEKNALVATLLPQLDTLLPELAPGQTASP